METGHLIGGRFKVLSLAGTGGMGKVYRAQDKDSGIQVAVKILSLDAKKYSQRFLREASVMAQLDHPNIVGYFDYGHTETGAPYIVMEWVNGEDLRQRMNRKHVTLDEALQIIVGVGDALAFAEKRGVIHRDLKPSNLMLVDGNLNHIKLLDFGIARWRGPAVEKMTRTGISIGTPGYMAPEQSRGESTIDGRADIYALGCVVYECLVGQRPFQGEDIVKVLTRTAVDKPPRVRAHRSDISIEFDDLLADMMAFLPDERPKDGSRMAQRALSIPSTYTRKKPAKPTGLSSHEKSFLSLLVSNQSSEIFESQVHSLPPDLQYKVESYDNGTSAIAIHSTLFDAEYVSKIAAQCALDIRAKLPTLPLFLTLVVCHWDDARELRDLANRCARWLTQMKAQPSPPLWLDRASALFAREQFAVTGTPNDEAQVFTLSEGNLGPVAHQVKMRRSFLASPFVGREKESQYLQERWQQSAEETTLPALLLTGPQGIGKSRIVEFFTHSIPSHSPDTRVIQVFANPHQEPFAALRALTEALLPLLDSASLQAKRSALQTHLYQFFDGSKALHIAGFLGELLNIPFVANTDHQALAAARGNEAMMHDYIAAATTEYIQARSLHHPLLLIIEEFHNVDLLSQKALERVQRAAKGHQWLLIALSRHETASASTSFVSLPISPLSQAASLLLSPKLSKRMLQLAQGNPLFLEELLHNNNQGIPSTLRVILSAPLYLCSPSQRRFLRAASILGTSFSSAGASLLLGPPKQQDILDDLVESHILTPTEDKAMYAFSSELFRRTVYATNLGSDLSLGHSLAARLLISQQQTHPERKGLKTTLKIARHANLAGKILMATTYYEKAAQCALATSNLSLAQKCVTEGLSIATDKESIGKLQRIEMDVAFWKGQHGNACEHGLNALEQLQESPIAWALAAGVTTTALGHCDAIVDILPIVKTLKAHFDSEPQPDSHFLAAAAQAASALFQSGHYSEAVSLYSLLPTEFSQFPQDTQAHLLSARAWLSLSDGDLSHFLSLMQQSAHHFASCEDVRNELLVNAFVGLAHSKLGQWDQAEERLRHSLIGGRSLKISYIHSFSAVHLGSVMLSKDHFAEAKSLTESSIRAFAEQSNGSKELLARVQLAKIYTEMQEFQPALAEVQLALGGTSTVESVRMFANAQLAHIQRHLGNPSDALEHAQQAYDLFANPKQVKEGEAIVSLAIIEALLQCGQTEKAKAALTAAFTSLRWRMQRITDLQHRRTFVQQIPEHARIVKLAKRLGISDNTSKEPFSL